MKISDMKIFKLLKSSAAVFRNKRITAPAVIFFLCLAIFYLAADIPDNNIDVRQPKSASVSASNTDKTGPEREMIILHTNDEHSGIIPHSPVLDFNTENDKSVGGMNRLAGTVEEIVGDYQEGETPVFLFNAGDFLAGTPFSWLAPEGYGLELKLMQKIGYDAAVLGNHEFDYGVDVLQEYMEYAGYPDANEELTMFGSNIIAPDDHYFQEYYRDYRIIEIDGVKIGILGLIGEGAARIAPDTGQLEFERPPETAQRVLDVLEGYDVDITIVLTHAGLEEDRELAREVKGLDIIVGGHSHDVLEQPEIINDTYILQAGDSLEYLGRMDLVYNKDQEEIDLSDYEMIRLDSEAASNSDSDIDNIIDEYTEKLNRLIGDITGGRFTDIKEPVVTGEFDLRKEPYVGENPVGNFITDAMRIEASKELEKEVDIAFQGNGQIRGGFYAGGEENLITFYDLAAPNSLGTGPEDNFGFPLVSGYITGEEIETLLEVAAFIYQVESDRHFIHFSGLRYSYNPDNALLGTIPVLDIPILPMQAVTETEFYPGSGRQPDGSQSEKFTEFEDDKLYKLVTDSHMLSQISLVEDIIPWVDLRPKDADGNPLDIDDMEEHVVAGEEGNLKVWQAVVNYADSLSGENPEQAGIARMPDYYAGTQGRIAEVDTVSHKLILILILLLTAAVIGVIFRRIKN